MQNRDTHNNQDQTSHQSAADDTHTILIKRGPSSQQITFSEAYKFSRHIWRKERDSNSRYGSPHTPFPGVRLQPLGHLSVFDWRRGGDSNPRYAFINV